MRVDTSSSTEIHETGGERRSWRDSEAWQTFNAIRPFVSWIVMGASMLVMLYLGFRDTKAEQSAAIVDLDKRLTGIEKVIPEKSNARDRQIADLKASMVTSELFNERTDNIADELKDIKADQKEILNRLPVRLP